MILGTMVIMFLGGITAIVADGTTLGDMVIMVGDIHTITMVMQDQVSDTVILRDIPVQPIIGADVEAGSGTIIRFITDR